MSGTDLWLPSKPADLDWADLGAGYLYVGSGASAPTADPFPISDFDAHYAVTGFNGLYTGAASIVANSATGCRMMCTRPGKIHDFVLLVGGASSGNIDAGVYTFDGTTYTAAWRLGSTPCPSSNSWHTLGNPNVAVARGQIVYLVLACDNATATFARTTLGNVGYSQMPAGGISAPRLAWSLSASFPLPPTFADASVANIGSVPALGMGIS